MTLVMIIMICVGCALILAGLAIVGYRSFKLAKAAPAAGLDSADLVNAVVRRSQKISSQVERLAANQRVLTERLESLSASTARLNYLRDQLDEATGHIFKLKS